MRLARTLLPHPLLSLALLAMWLLLQQSLSPGNIVLGLIVGLLAGKAMSALQPEAVGLRKPWLLLPLAGRVTWDIIRSNLAVAWIVISSGRRKQTSGFMTIPLDLKNRTALAILAIILTSTPGTVWLEFENESGVLLIHVLDLVDEEVWVDIIKNRYESLLLEIFA